MKELALHIMDLVDNSIRANATQIDIIVCEDIDQNKYSIQIIDNGIGMDQETLEKVSNPFYTSRTVRKVGLGIPLFRQAVEQTNGNFSINSTPNIGTTITGAFTYNHYDRQSMGNIAETLSIMFAMNQKITITYTHKTTTGSFTMSNAEIKSALDNADLNHISIIKGIEELLMNQLISINFSN